MALNAAATIIPGRGTVYVAAPDTTCFTNTQMGTLDPTSTPPTGWDCIGHTSRDNTVALGKDGGDANQQGSWWDDGIRSTNDPVQWSITVNSLQIDALTLGLAFGGGNLDATNGYYEFGTTAPVSKALFVLMIDGSSRMGIYCPNTSITLGDAPEVAVDAFFEIQLSGQVLASSSTGKRMRFLKPSLISS